MASYMSIKKPTSKQNYDHRALVNALRSEIGEEEFTKQLNEFILWGK